MFHIQIIGQIFLELCVRLETDSPQLTSHPNQPHVSCQQRPLLDLTEQSSIYLSGMLHLPQESYFIMVLAALFPLKTTSHTTINLKRLTGTLHDLFVCTLCQRVWRGIPKEGVFLHLTEQE